MHADDLWGASYDCSMARSIPCSGDFEVDVVNKENNWCISSPHDHRKQSFYNVSAVIYKTKEFVMFVAVNNDVHDIPVLVNKKTVVN